MYPPHSFLCIRSEWGGCYYHKVRHHNEVNIGQKHEDFAATAPPNGDFPAYCRCISGFYSYICTRKIAVATAAHRAGLMPSAICFARRSTRRIANLCRETVSSRRTNQVPSSKRGERSMFRLQSQFECNRMASSPPKQ